MLDPAQRDALLERGAEHPGYFFADVFRKTAAMLATERWPFPPGDHITLARIVHLLAFRPFARRHESMPAGQWVNAPHEVRYLEYLDAVLDLNRAIDRAANSGEIKLRWRTTGASVRDWHLPDSNYRGSLKRAILEGDMRRAVDFVVSTDWLIVPYPHFAPSLTVSLSEFSAWAEKDGIAGPGEICRLLDGQPKEIPSHAGAISAFFGSQEVDLEAGVYPEKIRQEAERAADPVAACQGASDSDAKEPPQKWRNGLKRMAYEEAAKLIRKHGVLHGPALWAAMCARGDVKVAGRDSGQIEPKVFISNLIRGEARIGKTQVQNAWRNELAELLKNLA